MPVTLAIPFRDAKRPPPLPVAKDGAASSAPPPLPSMRVPKAIVVHDANGDQIDVQAAVLKARRATEELEWQAQVKRARETQVDSDEAEWEALRARMKALPVSTPPRPAQPRKPALKLAPTPAAQPVLARVPAVAVRSDAAEKAEEEREWQELRARARIEEEREWEELMARARLSSAPAASHPFDAQLVQRPRLAPKPARVVAWP